MAISNAASAAVYDWTGGTTGLWSNAANWTAEGVPTGAAPTTGDTANLNDTAANRTITYDLTVNSSLGTLTFTQTSAATNTLDVQSTVGRTVTVSNPITLAASGGGTAKLLLDPGVPASGNNVLTFTPSITLNSGGVLELSSYNKGTIGGKSTIGGSIAINNGGTLISDSASVDASDMGTYANTINGSLTLAAGGSISLGIKAAGGNASNGGGTQSTHDGLALNGNFVATGGTFSAGFATDILYLNGQNNSIQLSSGGIAANVNLFSPGTAGLTNSTTSLLSDAALTGGVQLRQTNATDVSATMQLGAVTPGNALSMGQIVFQGKAIGGTEKLQLASDISTNAPLNQSGTLANIKYVVDLNGNTLTDTDATHTFVLPTGSNGSWSLENDKPSSTGTIKAVNFDLSGPAGGSSVGSNVVLVATGTGGKANNLGNAVVASTVSATSTFKYAGSASTATPDTLTSNRSIGNLIVAPAVTGTLQLLSNISTSTGSASVAAGGTLDLKTFSLTTTDLTVTGTGVVTGGAGSSISTAGVLGGTGTVGAAAGITSSGTVAPGGAGTVGALTIGSGSGALTLAGSDTAAFDITDSSTFDQLAMASNLTGINYGGSLALNFAYSPADGQTFPLVSGFGSETGNFNSITSNLDSSSYTLSFAPATGVLTVTAVPEPASLALVGMLGLLGFRRRRRIA